VNKNKLFIFVLSLIIALVIFGYKKDKDCNKTGSLAEKINFANKNCLNN
jgi:hypothetical protein